VVVSERRRLRRKLITGAPNTTIPPAEPRPSDDDMEMDGFKDRVREIFTHVTSWFRSLQIQESELSTIIREAFKIADLNYGVKQANEWAHGFTFPEGTGDVDASLLRSLDFNFPDLVRRKQAQRRPERFNLDRLKYMVPETDPDWYILVDLASGMSIVTDPDFSPNGHPPPFRKRYLDVQACVNKIMYEKYSGGEVVLIPKDVALQIPGIHFSSMHWTTKPNVMKGRPLGDPSNAKTGCALNGGSTRELVRAKWGDIHHPTLTDIIRMILVMVDKYGIGNIRLWKMDLSNAFGLLDIRPENAQLLAFELTGDIVMIHLWGMFGWAGTPFAFDPITRVIRRMVSTIIAGLMNMYVDDLLGVSARNDVQEDIQKADDFVRGLMGPDSINPRKTKVGEGMDMLGWHICCKTGTVYLAEHNFQKTLIGFFSINLELPVSRNDLERLGSWAARYAEVIPLLRPFVSPIYQNMAGVYSSHARVDWTPAATISVCMWRACLCLGGLRREAFARPFESFREGRRADVRLSYDGSLQGLGIVLEERSDEVWIRICHASIMVNYADSSDSGYQNTMEFTAIVLGMILIIQRKVRGKLISLVGDNTTSLKWSTNGRVKSAYALQSAVVFALLGTQFGLEVAETRHIAGTLNTECDSLSRGYLSGDETYDSMTVTLEGNELLKECVHLVDPFVKLTTVSDFTTLWTRVSCLLQKLTG